MASSFDLFRNPFILLDLDLTASAKAASDAFDDAITDGLTSEPDLVAARQAVLTPLLRLNAEVGALPDVPAAEWRPILIALKSTQSLSNLRKAFAEVAPLSRSNLLTHIAARAPLDGPTLVEWVTAQSEIAPDEVHREIVRLRVLAGSIRPDREGITAALENLRERQARALFEGVQNPPDAVGAVTACTQEIITQKNEKQIDALGAALNAYHRCVDQELSLRRERISSTITSLRSDPDGPGNLSLIIDAVKFWQEVAEPFQLFEAYKGRDEPAAQGVLQEIRALAIDLANDFSRFDLALSLTKACQDAFNNLPRAVQQLDEDRSTIEGRIQASKVEPLAIEIGNLGHNLQGLTTDLRRCGFGRSSVGSAKTLRSALSKAVISTKGSTASELPWLMMRSIAVKLNNEFEDPTSALAFMKGLLDLAQELDATDEVLGRLREDTRAIERNKLETDLLDHLKDGRLRAAISAIENLLQDYKSPEERETLQKLKADVEGKKVRQYLRWSFWPAVALIGIVVANIDSGTTTGPKPSQQSSYTPAPAPTYSYTPAPPPIRAISEEKPPIGANLQFSEANIRYCSFQKVRLEFIKLRISGNDEINEFNSIVDDYNARCAKYRYRVADRTAVEAELFSKKSQLEGDAQRMIDGWRVAQVKPRFTPSRSEPTQQVFPSPPVSPTTTRPPVQSSSPSLPTQSGTPPPLPPGILIGEGAPPKIETAPDLLKIADATLVQQRLIELGFAKPPADGTWGPQSRSALRAFRISNGFAASDVWEPAVAEKLFSADAIRTSGIAPSSQSAQPTALFAPPSGATMNPLNRDDATRIHARLRELGYFQGRNVSVWSVASRAALRDFQVRSGLSQDDWDAATEQRLFSAGHPGNEDTELERFTALFGGTWATTVSACPGSGGNSDGLPLTVTRNRAEAGGAGCDFQAVKSEGDRWLVKAQCKSENRSWNANITLARLGDQFKWSSERGTTTYFRCGP